MTYVEKCGFSLIEVKELSELSATLYRLEHKRSGAQLIYLDREDENKTFSIGFGTPPSDDTGVFHIIEHSVLCGSRKYPLNDPFAELLKGSLNTFLNAVTYEDRTIYPVSSRCERDFLNLVDVYLDAVFAPNLLTNKSIFRQEGWRYEYDGESDSLSLNGVVYNEMKGAYSSPDELGMMALNRALFGGSVYCRDSGGDPSSIPSLTYEQFKAAHQKYYHPSNSYIFLDGKMELEGLLSLIDSHISRFERGERFSLAGKSENIIAPDTTVRFEIAESEEEGGRARVLYGFVYSDYSDKDAHLAASVLSDILCGSNASPLKKALLERGLAKDAMMYSAKSREATVIIEVRDADESRIEEIDSTVKEIIGEAIKGGIAKEKLSASLNSIEFRLRERDFGSLPTGIAFAMSVYGSWVYGGLPEDALLTNDALLRVREKINSDFFEESLRKMTLDCPHRARVIMLPDKELGERSAREEEMRLKEILFSMSRDELDEIKAEEATLRLWQEREPTDEELSSLPTLSLSDIPEKISRPTASLSNHNGVKVLRCPIKTNGIVYISLFFDASDVKKEELINLSMLCSALINMPTESYDPLSLQNEIKANLGAFFTSFTVGNKDGVVTPYFKVGISALTSKTKEALHILREVLLTSRIKDEGEIERLLLQTRSHIEDMMIASGESVALARVEAAMSSAGAVSEYLSGYEAYKRICEISKDRSAIASLTRGIERLLATLTDRRRLTVALTGECEDGLIESIISLFDEGLGDFTPAAVQPCAAKKEFIAIPSKVAYAVMGGRSPKIAKNLGLLRVARSILSYEYLWNEVRVRGGAYGTGFIPKKDGSVFFYSYRDPSPARSLDAYRGAADYLRRVADAEVDITKFIIGSIGEYDTLITPRVASLISSNDYLNGWSAKDEERVRAQMLSASTDDLRRVADIIDGALTEEYIAVVGGGEQISAADDDTVIIKI